MPIGRYALQHQVGDRVQVVIEAAILINRRDQQSLMRMHGISNQEERISQWRNN